MPREKKVTSSRSREPERTPPAPPPSFSSKGKKSSKKTSIRNLWPGKMVVPAEKTATGKAYLFEKAGSIVSVSREDVEVLLALVRSKSCCGGVNEERRLFESLGG